MTGCALPTGFGDALRRGGVRIALVACLLLALLPSTVLGAAVPAAAPERFLEGTDGTPIIPGWDLRMGILATDNIVRAPDSETEEIIGVAEFGANWRYIGSRFAAAFDGNIGYRHYTQGNFDDEARANFLAAGDWFIIPDTLDWFVTDRLANAPVNPLATTSPTNVQFVNVLETGPRLTLRPGSTNELTLGASRTDVRAEESPIDHVRDSGTVDFAHNVSANSSFGLVANASRVNFEPDANAQDFEQRDAHLDFQSRNDTVNFSVAGGYSRIELADGFIGDSPTGWIRVGARRTSDSYIYAALERTASDTATAMLQDELLLEQGGVTSIIVSGDPYFSDHAVLRYTRGWRAHEWFVAGNASELDYFVSPLDQEQRGFRLGVDLALSSRLLLSLTAVDNAIEYLNLSRSDDIRALLAETDYRIDRNWSLVTGLRYLERESTDPDFSFDETMLTLFISYSPRGRDPLGSEL